MYKGNTIAVAVPAYNEEGYVGEVIDTIPEFVDRVYVVDDGSTDDTWDEIREHAEARNERDPPEADEFDEKIVPIQHDENRGVGGGIKTGYLRAREDRIDVTAVMGGDAQMNPAELKKYIDPIVRGDADYAKGNRFMRREDFEAMPRFRLVGNLTLTYLTKIASGYWKTGDPQNGYTAISLAALDDVPIEDMYEYYGYCNDLLVKLNAHDVRVADVARSSTFAYEDGWKSHIDYSEYVPRVSGMLFRNFLWRLKDKYLTTDFHPLALFYLFGMGSMGAAVVGALASLRKRGAERGGAGWLLVFLAGVTLFLFGAAFDLEDNQHLERQVFGDEYAGDEDVELPDERELMAND